MKYAAFCQYLKQLDQTAKRLEITAILAELIKKLPPEEVEKAIFLSLGYLNPPYDQIQFNMADKMVIRALELCYGVSKQKVAQLYADLGDLGDVAGKLGAQKQGTDQSITQVYKELCELALDEGTGSQDRKITGLSDLLGSLEPVSAKYTIRVVLGTTRLGFTEKTVIDALSHLLSGDKSVSRAIEEIYNIHPNIAYLARIIKEKGLKGLNSVKLETGVPVLAQKAQRLSDPEDILKKMAGTAWAEYKLDGVRVQLHLDRKKVGLNKNLDQNSLFSFNKDSVLVKTFTRNLEENTYQFPDIAESALKQIQAESIILDGEAIGFDPKTGRYIPFQDMMQRKRKHNVGSYVKQIPLKYIVFDILYLNGQDLTSCSLFNRHKQLATVIKSNGVLELAEHLETNDPAELWQFFESSKEKNLEGVMIKNPQAPYRAGAREFTWIKLKKRSTDLLEDTIDCVVLGYYFGRGARADFGIGGFLCGIWDNKKAEYLTLTKVGTGLKDEEWIELKNRCDKLAVEKSPKNVEVAKVLNPDVWVEPQILVELGGEEISISQTHTSGYALRFPRLMKFRDDKSPTDTTSPEEIRSLLKSQRKPADS